MSDQWRREVEPLYVEGGIHMPYSWTVGRVGSRFLIELRDNGRIMASRCPKCTVVWVPPRLRCPECFVEIADSNWLEVGPEGTLRHFTVVHYPHPNQPLAPPFAYGIIDLDGAGRGLTHIIHGCDLSGLHSGMRLKPVWASDRQGSILDISHFTLTGGKEQ